MHNFTYVYIYIYIYIHICVLYIYTYTYKYTYIYIYVYIRLHIYVYGPRQGSYMTKLGVLTHRKKERKQLRIPSDYIYIFIYIRTFTYIHIYGRRPDHASASAYQLDNAEHYTKVQRRDCVLQIRFGHEYFRVTLTDFD